MAQYEYDNNGNMTSDGHKGINVAYNYLNLPISVVKAGEGSMDWVYDAVGNKLSKTVRQTNLVVNDNPIANGAYQADVIQSSGTVAAGSNITFTAQDSVILKPGFTGRPNFTAKTGSNLGVTRHYVGGIEYYDGEMEAIYHEAGRVVLENNVWNYEYVLTDHLGNTRVVFRNVGGVATVVQENDYYPFGMEFETDANKYPYKYNGIEKVQDLGLNWDLTLFRPYASDIGRFLGVDVLSESAPQMTPFRFGFNDPISYSDPFGLFETRADAKAYKKKHGLKGKIERDSDGLYQIVNKKEGSVVVQLDGEVLVGAAFTDGQHYPSPYGEIKAAPGPNFWERLNNSSFVGSLVYNVANSVNVAARSGFYGRGDNVPTLDGQSVIKGSEEGVMTAVGGYSTIMPMGAAGNSLAKGLTTMDGFLFKGVNIKTPINIPVQRFGNMSLQKADYWGLRLGKSKFANRIFAAIKPEWNDLTQYTLGIIPKGTPIKFGIIGPQGLKYPGGSIQFIVNSRVVTNQNTKLIK